MAGTRPLTYSDRSTADMWILKRLKVVVIKIMPASQCESAVKEN